MVRLTVAAVRGPTNPVNQVSTVAAVQGPIITAIFYFASPENQWVEKLFPHFPDRNILVNDGNGNKMLYEGVAKAGQSIPYADWVEPLIWWCIFLLALYMAMVSIAVILRRQWMERERLAYPVAQVGLGQFPPITAISQDTILLAHALDDPPFPLVIFHLLPCLELHALQWCALNRIHSHFAGGRVKKVNPPIGHLYYRAESKLGFG